MLNDWFTCLSGSIGSGRSDRFSWGGNGSRDDVRRAGNAPGQAVGTGAVKAIRGVAVGVARLAVDLWSPVLLIQVVVLGRLCAALYCHRDVGLGSCTRRHWWRSSLPTGGYACRDWKKREGRGRRREEERNKEKKKLQMTALDVGFGISSKPSHDYPQNMNKPIKENISK